MNLYAIRRRDFWGTPEELQDTAARSAEVGDEMSDDVRWIRTYVVQEESGKLGTVCLYEGTSADEGPRAGRAHRHARRRDHPRRRHRHRPPGPGPRRLRP